ncbi:DUF2177 family protein [Roseibium sp.]|uniref:DUF2177 family protein n=1 Tax=Roseibium sp. TaxID=1936156 RepID=UPI003A98849A
MQYLVAYIATAVVFLGIDYVWLAHVSRGFYAERLGHLLMEKPNMAAAAGFYAIYVVGIVIFAVAPALRTGSLSTALIYGGLFGFFAYATYDMTNFATLKDWPPSVVMVDVLWGTVLTGVSACLGTYLTRLAIS